MCNNKHKKFCQIFNNFCVLRVKWLCTAQRFITIITQEKKAFLCVCLAYLKHRKVSSIYVACGRKTFRYLSTSSDSILRI